MVFMGRSHYGSARREMQGRAACRQHHARYPWDMDILKMLTDLREQRDQIDQAIIMLERIAAGQSKRRGRPPAWLASAAKRRGRPPGSKNKVKAQSST
jgi:hypothetical protein